MIKSPLQAGGVLLAGLFAMSASAAIASQPSFVVATDGPVSTTAVSIADLDLSNPHDRARLTTRVNVASRAVCHIMRGSALNRIGDADRCVTEARANAWSQVDQRSAVIQVSGRPG